MPRINAHPRFWRSRLHEIIYEADTPAGKLFDIALLVCILVSVAAVVLDSVSALHDDYGHLFRAVEWIATVSFTVEYALRLLAVTRPLDYMVSFYGIIDLLAIVPGYLSLVFSGAQSLIVIRALRLLRVFRGAQARPFRR